MSARTWTTWAVPAAVRAEIAELARTMCHREVGDRFGVDKCTVGNICRALAVPCRRRGAPTILGEKLWKRYVSREKSWPCRPRLTVTPGGIKL